MLQRFLQGLAFGAGFAVALVAVMALFSSASYWFFSPSSSDDRFASSATIDTPPALSTARRFLGTTGVYSGDFAFRDAATLAPGDGKIVGKVFSGGQPVSGVRIRLALNGSVMSGWGTTDALGVYTVAVPFGRYRIDGYDLDHGAAQRALGGKIDDPQNRHQSSSFEVSQGSDGEGLTLRYVDPVVTLGPAGNVASSTPVVLSWQPYPGAQRYAVQLYETESATDYPGPDTVFPWRARPEVEGTSYDVTAAGAALKPGYYYTIEIEARDAQGRALSKTARNTQEKDFRFIAGASE